MTHHQVDFIVYVAQALQNRLAVVIAADDVHKVGQQLLHLLLARAEVNENVPGTMRQRQHNTDVALAGAMEMEQA
jgi:hypothetical protein